MPGALSSTLLPQAANNRHGLVFSPQTAHISKSDATGIYHVGVPLASSSTWKSASGGVAYNLQDAQLAAIGEGVERYCAAIATVPLRTLREIPKRQRLDAADWTLFSKEQRARPDFPFKNLYAVNCRYTNMYEFGSNKEYWVPHPLVVLRDDYATGIPTSSGLAAGPTAASALLRAIQELIERDALMATWLHSLPGKAIAPDPTHAKTVADLGGEMQVFDLTPAYSPFPVIAVAGGIPTRGVWRYSLGVACRETLIGAREKAFLEWCQGVFFAGVYPKYVDTATLATPNMVTSFDDHAIYYTQNPTEWAKLPLLQQRHTITQPTRTGAAMSAQEAVVVAVRALQSKAIRLLYRDLTTIDALQAGVRVVRVASPDLIPINAHHAWPFIGGSASNIASRYPSSKTSSHFPNAFPHPLG